MSGVFCGIEGCDKHPEHWSDDEPPFKNEANAVKHLHAKADRAHDVDEQEFRDQLATASDVDEQADQEADQQESGDGSSEESTDDQQESSSEQEDSMVSEEELQRQRGKSSTGSGSDQQDSGDGGGEETTADQQESSGGGFLPNVSTSTLIGVLVLVFVLVVAYRVLSEDPDEQAVTGTDQSESGDGSSEESTDDQHESSRATANPLG